MFLPVAGCVVLDGLCYEVSRPVFHLEVRAQLCAFCRSLPRFHIEYFQTERLVSSVTLQARDGQRVGQRVHDPAASLGSSSSAQTLQGHECRPQCEEGHYGSYARRPDGQGEDRGCVTWEEPVGLP